MTCNFRMYDIYTYVYEYTLMMMGHDVMSVI